MCVGMMDGRMRMSDFQAISDAMRCDARRFVCFMINQNNQNEWPAFLFCNLLTFRIFSLI